jgi:hypothetical protein
LVFRSEVHQDGCVRQPLRHGLAVFGDEELETRLHISEAADGA